MDNKEKEWQELREWLLTKSNEVQNKMVPEQDIKNLGWLVITESIIMMGFITRIGELLANVEKRVVNLEKSLERLHLKVK